MSNQEFAYWMAFYREKSRLQEAASKPKKKEGLATQEFKKTMGNRQTAM